MVIGIWFQLFNCGLWCGMEQEDPKELVLLSDTFLPLPSLTSSMYLIN